MLQRSVSLPASAKGATASCVAEPQRVALSLSSPQPVGRPSALLPTTATIPNQGKSTSRAACKRGDAADPAGSPKQRGSS